MRIVSESDAAALHGIIAGSSVITVVSHTPTVTPSAAAWPSVHSSGNRARTRKSCFRILRERS